MNRASLVLLLLLTLVLHGCASDSTDPVGDDEPKATFPSLGITQVSGVIDAPTSVVPTEVTNSLEGVAVTSGSFSLDQFQGGRQLAVASSADGTPMLLGWLDADHPALSPRSTVEVLLFYASGAFVLPSSAQIAVMDLLAEMSELDAPATQLAGLLAADSNTLANAPTSLIASIQTLIDDMLASLEETKGVAVTGGLQSGLRVDTVEGVNSITLVNANRRPCHAFVERTATVDEAGVVTPNHATLTSFPMSSIQGLNGAVGTFVDIIWGRYAFTETSAPPVALPAVENAERTRYKLTVVGPGASDGDLGQLTTAQLAIQQQVVQTFVVRDLFLPLIVNVLIPNSSMDDYLGFVGGGDVVQDFINILTVGVPGIWDLAYAGDIDGALDAAYNAVMGSGTLRDAILQRMVDHIADMRGLDAADRAAGMAQSFLRIMTAVDMFLAAFDASAVGAAVLDSDRANVWTIEVTQPRVVLSPETAEIAFGDEVTLTVTVPETSGAGVDLVYKWICDGDHGTLTDGISGHVNTFDSTHNVAIFTAGDAVPGGETITVEVYTLAVPGQSDRVLVGETSAVITVSPGVITVNPAVSSLQAGHDTHLTVTLDPEPSVGEMTFTWTGANGVGSLAVDEDQRGAVYTADLSGEGLDIITVGATQWIDDEPVSWGTAQATINVGAQPPAHTESRIWEDVYPSNTAGYFGYRFVYGYVFEEAPNYSWFYELTLIRESGSGHTTFELGDTVLLRDPDVVSSGARWIDADGMIDAYGSNLLNLGENELAYVFSWRPTTGMPIDQIMERLPDWQTLIYGNLEMVWEVRYW